MPPAWLVFAGIVFGVVLGVGVTLAVVAARREGRGSLASSTPRVPAGVSRVLELLDSASVILDAAGRAIAVSPGATAMGLVRNGSLANSELEALVDRVRRSGESAQEEFALGRGQESASSIDVLARAARLKRGLVLLLVDDRSEARRVDEVRRDFIANVSHELKTPIGAVSLLAEAIDAVADEPAEVRRFASRLSTEADRLTRLTQDIIELSRLQTGDPSRGASSVPLAGVIAQAVDRVGVAAQARGIDIAVGDVDRHAVVLGDAAQLATAIHNLVENAIQFSPDGARIGIGVVMDGDAVEIAVADRGAGIPEADRSRVFERFYRGDAARSRETGGTGLGLAIVKHIVQNHGGRVAVWSAVGEGSTFTIRLPLAAGSAPAATPANPSREEFRG